MKVIKKMLKFFLEIIIKEKLLKESARMAIFKDTHLYTALGIIIATI